MTQPELKSVPESEIPEAIDSWIIPTNLPNDVAVFPRRFLGERFWAFDPEKITLIPAPALKIADTLIEYADFPVLVHNHRHHILGKQEKIPEEYRPYTIYFLSDVYLRCREGATRFVYCIKYENDKWVEEEVSVEVIPLKGKCRIITMR